MGGVCRARRLVHEVFEMAEFEDPSFVSFSIMCILGLFPLSLIIYSNWLFYKNKINRHVPSNLKEHTYNLLPKSHLGLI